MKESSINNLRKLQEFTGKLCASCPSATANRCCDTEFCKAVEQGLQSIGKEIPKTTHPTLQYMGEKGCVVPAELRPGCSGFLCNSHLTDRKVRKQYDHLHTKFMNDPAVMKLMDIANKYLFRTLGPAPKRWR